MLFTKVLILQKLKHILKHFLYTKILPEQIF